MPTRRGWAVAAAGAALLLAGRVLALGELTGLGAGLLTLLAAAAASVRLANRDVAVSRSIGTVRASPGTPAEVEVAFANHGRGRSAPLEFHEHVPESLGRSIHLFIPPLPPGGRRTLRYELHPSRRGRYWIGPGRLSAADPFGLASLVSRPLGRASILVYPRIEALGGLLQAALPASTGSPRPSGPTRRSDEFFTMREYQPGDDLRKIHWRSTARVGRLMIRQEEQRALGRATVVLDDREGVHALSATGPDSFESAVESAASLVNLFLERDFHVRLALASGRSSPAEERFGTGPDHLHRLMERLAAAVPAAGDLASRAGGLRAGPAAGGYLLVVTTAVEPSLLAVLGPARGGEVLVVLHPLDSFRLGPAGSSHGPEAALLLERAGVPVLTVAAGSTLSKAWEPRRAGLSPRWGAAVARRISP